MIETEFREHLGIKGKKDGKDGDERSIPAVKEGQEFHPVKVSVSEHFTHAKTLQRGYPVICYGDCREPGV